MSRIKITYRWNGDIIREKSEPAEKMVDANMETPAVSKWKVQTRPTLGNRLPLWDLDAITKGIEIMRKRDMFLFTNIIYQALGGDVVFA